jgi:cytoskeletal protein CcmA (bactofilin family)
MNIKTNEISESAINIVAEGTRLEGKIDFDKISRVHGTLIGEIRAHPGSTLILSESAVVEGNIEADVLFIDGYVRGEIIAKTRTVISGTGRVVGSIKTPSLSVDFGAYFEGKCTMEKEQITASPELKPV